MNQPVPAAKPPPYTTREADVARERARILALWREGLAQDGRPEQKFDWFYERNAGGRPGAVFLVDGSGTEVGVASVTPRAMRLGGQPVSGGLLVDFIVAEPHRNFFPALALQRAIRRLAESRHAVLFGFPNASSAAVVGRAGYRPVGPMVRYGRVLRSSTYLARYLPSLLARPLGALVDRLRLGAVARRRRANRGFETAWIDRPDARFDELWSRIDRPNLLIGVRDRAYLEWRFAQSPFARHTFFTVSSPQENRLLGYVVCEQDGETLHVRDFLVDDQAGRASTALALDLMREAHRRGCRSVSVHFLGDRAVHEALRGAGFVPRDERPVYAITGALDALANEGAWYLTYADVDE